MAFQTWLAIQARNETIAAPFVSSWFPLGPNDGMITIHFLPGPNQSIGSAGQRIVWWGEGRLTATQVVVRLPTSGDVKGDLDPSGCTKDGFFGGSFDLYGGEYDEVRAAYYVENGPVTFGVEGDIATAKRQQMLKG